MRRIRSIGLQLLVFLGPTTAIQSASEVPPPKLVVAETKVHFLSRQATSLQILDEQTKSTLRNTNTLAELSFFHHSGVMKEPHARHLQSNNPEVVCMNDVASNSTTRTCYIDDFPTVGFVFVFYECPTIASATLSDCSRCSVFSSESYGTIQNETDACNSCTKCTATPGNLGYDCGNHAVGSCSVVDCAGECVGGSLAPTASPAPTIISEPHLVCNAIGDGSLFDCQLEDIPYDGLVTYFENCPNAPGATIFNCTSCFIYDSDSETSNCLNCDLCVQENTVTYDCSNLVVDDECSKRDCAGVCLHELPTEADPPTGAPLVDGTSAGASGTGGAGAYCCAVLQLLLAVMVGMMADT